MSTPSFLAEVDRNAIIIHEKETVTEAFVCRHSHYHYTISLLLLSLVLFSCVWLSFSNKNGEKRSFDIYVLKININSTRTVIFLNFSHFIFLIHVILES